MWLQHRCSEPDSAAIVFQFVLVLIRHPVLRPASCQSIVRLAATVLIVRAFTTPLAVPTSTVFDQSIGPWYLPCSNRESRGPRRRLDGCKGFHHTRSPNCAKGNSAPSHISFTRCHDVSTLRKPTVHAGCTRHKPRQQIVVCWYFDNLIPLASLIDLTHPLMTFTELSAAPLDCGSPSADVSCTTSPVQASFTALSSDRMEGSLSHRNTTLW